QLRVLGAAGGREIEGTAVTVGLERTSAMDEMKAVDLGQVMSSIRAAGRPNTVLWQAPDSVAFVARGREFRSEFHSDPSDEVMYMIKGDMNLHYRTPEGDEKVAGEGLIYSHWPRLVGSTPAKVRKSIIFESAKSGRVMAGGCAASLARAATAGALPAHESA